jgi:bla regulator protein blaR1
MSPLVSLANHLWQSTLFAAVASLLALALRRDRAQIRYALWFAASVKFLIPLSLLVMAGSHLGPRTLPGPASKAITPSRIPLMVEQVSQPFAVTVPLAAMPPAQPSFQSLIPAVLGLQWAAGFLFVAASWWRRWRQIRAALFTATPTASPLRLPIGIEAMSSPEFIELGVFGVRRPILLLPDGIAGHLTPSELDAILAHELCHIRRRDNLAAAVHMAVEALFWFHPLVWWIGARLMEERERACDEEVLRMGSEPAIYAEGILKICELYSTSPLPCAAGVTGGNLKKRIEEIMTNPAKPSLSAGKKLLLAAGGTLAVILPVLVGIAGMQLRAQAPDISWQTEAGGKTAFATASVRRSEMNPSGLPRFFPPAFPLDSGDAYSSTAGRFAFNFPLPAYITFAYKTSPVQEQYRSMIAGLPQWVATDTFEIEAQAEGNPTKDQMRLMMQSLLADRFKLAVHFETRVIPVFALTQVQPGKLGPKLHPHEEGPPCPASFTLPPPFTPISDTDVFPSECGAFLMRGFGDDRTHEGARNITMAQLAASFRSLSRPTFDQTGLNGRYDFTFDTTFYSAVVAPNRAEPDLPAPDFLDALREQLGLTLKSTTGPVQILVIDHVEMPSEN